MSKKKNIENENGVAKKLVNKPMAEIDRKPLNFEPHSTPLHTAQVFTVTILGEVVTITFENEAVAQHFFAKMAENMVQVESESKSTPSDEPPDAVN